MWHKLVQLSLLLSQYWVSQIEFLVGGGGSEEGLVVLGLLTQLTEGRYYLEDDTGFLPLDMAKAKFHSGEQIPVYRYALR